MGTYGVAGKLPSADEVLAACSNMASVMSGLVGHWSRL